ncbi:calcium-translocating P-type ATPase, PMCA-type [Prevotella sp. OH937_COT-195]|uniref:calcium-translocating P-type ATPase, PMCA-type n=1 Tax=Prevotella sp. OH937_COT-195 TaxID=2491051 RepID=UPI000F64A939|nr:calcium-translocating P-type ATPase, PMCA-type [Prevotella sp. OH937_COT-195]RRD01949.1 calcium-translocating P-type ATPase, PMCA-type [Prevotella sp. OH937_COT-195]
MGIEKSNIPFKHEGLGEKEVNESRNLHGDNILTPPQKTSMWRLYIEKYNDPIIKILLVAATISLALAFFDGKFMETIGIFIAIFLATTIGFYFESDAARKFEALTSLGEEQPVKVRRAGQVMSIARREVVVGDIVLVETGDEIPADGTLVASSDLQIDESSLTGEPLTTKHADMEKYGERDGAYPQNLLLRSTMVMNGSGEYLVTAVGDRTEIGNVARSSSEDTGIKTPLNRQLDRLAKLISKVGFTIAGSAFVIFLVHDIITNTALWHSYDYIGMAETVLKYFMMAVTLIVMSVPEGLPMAVTLALALNMRRMLKSNNLVRKLHACETMGAVNVICTDKTGTLTQNRMSVKDMLRINDDDFLKDIPLTTAIAINTTAYAGVGNPTEIALIEWIGGEGADCEKVRREAVITDVMPFSTERKMMATAANVAGRTWLLVKGAPEIVMQMCDITDTERRRAEDFLREKQGRAMRTLALAAKPVGGDRINVELHGLRLQAIAALEDPVREDVPDAVAQCHGAGIDVKIVTGDISGTAIEIARQIGIEPTEGFHITGAEFAALNDEEALQRVEKLRVISRARPQDKQRLVQMLQKRGHVVAVTGDGTNDAPALHYAHVGLSLGSGTGVAKRASDMTLLDDSFRSITHAVMWGRSLYKNIQRFLFFQLVVNVTALLLVLAGSIIGTELPLTVTQILWVNLIMDTFAAMALASLPPSREVMAEKPRPQNDFILSRPLINGIVFCGMTFFAMLFAMLWHCLHNDADTGILQHELTLFFTTFVMLQVWNLLNAKTLGSNHSAFRYLHRDRGLLVVLLSIVAGQWLIVEFGGKMFRTDGMSWQEWAIVISATSVVLWVGELWRMAKRIVKSTM